MNILALDQSTNLTGYAYFEDGKLIEYNTIDTSKCGTTIERIAALKDWFESFIKTRKVEHVGLEDTQLQSTDTGHPDKALNPHVFQVLSKLLGIMELLCYSNGIDYTIVRSTEWKKTCKVKGRYRAEQKANAKQFVMELYGIDAEQDTADAICIGHHLLSEELKKDEWAF